MKLFVDTWGWVNIFNQREAHHQTVTEYYRDFKQRGGKIYTTDYVLDETFTLLFRRLSFPLGQQALKKLESAVEMGYLSLIWITPERFEATKIIRLKFQDKPLISFTDLTSMVVMQELEITQSLTGDAHFTHVGMGFQIVP